MLIHKKTMVLLFPNMNILIKKLQLTMLCNDQHTRKPLAVNNAAHLQNFICIGVSRSIHDVREIIWFRNTVTNQKHSQDKGDNLAQKSGSHNDLHLITAHLYTLIYSQYHL